MVNNHKNFEVKTDTKSLARSIIQVIEISKKHDLHCWLNYGALLGMVREKRLLPWNNDAELSCWNEKDIKKKAIKIVNDLSINGYSAYYYSTVGTINIKKQGIDININFMWDENPLGTRPHEECSKFKSNLILSYIVYWLAISMSTYSSGISFRKFVRANKREKVKIVLIAINKIFPIKIKKIFYKTLMSMAMKGKSEFGKTGMPSKYFKDFIKIDFYGSEISIPKRNRELLAFIYGEDWETPQENWSFYSNKNRRVSKIKFIDEIFEDNNIEFV
jgi:phosphorylcholine metabolism protein LicD